MSLTSGEKIESKKQNCGKTAPDQRCDCQKLNYPGLVLNICHYANNVYCQHKKQS